MAVGGLVLRRAPHRTCVGCRATAPQSELARLAGRPGRGAYVHALGECVDLARRGGLARSLRRAITDGERAQLAQVAVIPNQKAAGHDPAKAVERHPRIQAKE